MLLGAMNPDGSWLGAKQAGATRAMDEHETDVTQTCFALLFLRRSTAPPLVPVTPQGLTGGDGPPTNFGEK